MTLEVRHDPIAVPQRQGDSVGVLPGSSDPHAAHDHAVTFYERDDALFTTVAEYLAPCLEAGGAAALIATAAHRSGIRAALDARLPNVAALESQGRLTYADAQESLARLMKDGAPDPVTFETVVGAILTAARACRATPDVSVHVYGEMVHLLWADDRVEAAIALERLWNELAATTSFHLLCGYGLSERKRPAEPNAVTRVCAAHARVVGDEFRVGRASRADLAGLERHAQALEVEIQRRRELEGALREALAKRQEAERSLQQSQAQLEDLFENATLGIHCVDANGIILRANRAELELLGYAAEEYVGHHIREFHSDPDCIADMLERLGRGETLREYEATLRAKDGSVRHVMVSSNVLWQDGAFVHTRCFTRDVTEARQAEAVRRSIEARHHALFQNTLDAIMIVDDQGRYVDVNASMCRVFGRRREELVGRCFTEFVEPELLARAQAAFASLRTTGAFQGEFPLRSADGTLVELEWYSQAHFLPGLHYCVARDITARTRAERRLREADARKDEFLAMLAHELRNPLAPIVNVTQLIRMRFGNGADDIVRHLDLLDRQTLHLSKLIDDLLEVSRITRGKIRLERDVVNAADLVLRAVEMSRPLLDARGHQLDVTLPAEPIHLNADATRVAQVLGNLLNNAAKYTDEGGHVVVAAEREGRHVVFRVRDDGIGIPAELVPQLFELFAQGETSLDRSQGGLGIGLTLARGLVELHGGTVHAHSEGAGRGSEFVVRLPALEPRRRRARPADDGIEDPELPSRRVVVVDDNRDAADSLAELLQNAGQSVRVAHDGPSTLEVVRAHRAEIVLLDIGLPRMNGYEVAAELRREHGERLVLVALTGYGQQEDRRRSRAAGFDHHLVKPIRFATLREVFAES